MSKKDKKYCNFYRIFVYCILLTYKTLYYETL